MRSDGTKVAIPKSRSTGLKLYAEAKRQMLQWCRNPQIPVYGTETNYITDGGVTYSIVAIPKSRSTGLKRIFLALFVRKRSCRNPQIPVYGTETNRHPRRILPTAIVAIPKSRSTGLKQIPGIAGRFPEGVAIPKSRSTGLKPTVGQLTEQFPQLSQSPNPGLRD